MIESSSNDTLLCEEQYHSFPPAPGQHKTRLFKTFLPQNKVRSTPIHNFGFIALFIPE